MKPLGARAAGERLARMRATGLGHSTVLPVQVDTVTPWWCGVETSASAADALLQPLTWPKQLAWPAD